MHRNARLLGCVWLGVALGCGGSGGKASPSDGGKQHVDDADSGSDDGEDAGDDSADDGDAATPEEDAGTQDAGSSATNKGRMKGRVTYADGTAVGQVNLRVGGKVYKSDSRGVFSADDLAEGDQELSVDDSRVSHGQLKIKVQGDRLTQAQLAVLGVNKGMIADGAQDSEVSSGAFKLRVKAGALKDKQSQATISGEAELRFALVKDAPDLRAAPGLLKGQQSGHEVQLESFGMAELRFFQADNELALGSDAELELPLGPHAFADAQEVDAWSFDSEMGTWKQEGKASIDLSGGGNGVAKIKATHAAWWSVANPVAEPTCLTGKLVAASGQTLGGAWVQATGVDAWGSYGALTDDAGNFCLSVKSGLSAELSAFGVSGDSYFEWTQSVVADSAPAACGGSCKDLGLISGTSLFDECKGDVTHDQNHVLLLSSGEPNLDTSLKSGLEQLGHVATLGVSYDLFDGTIDLTPYDAVYLQANYNWSGRDMPSAGQRQLINWVNCGGGLVTTEWTTWKIGSGNFALIDAIFPAARTTAYSAPTMETYTKVTADATLNAGLPDSFSFALTNYGGTESNLNPRPGAVIYYDSDMLDSGLLGWSYNLGRVASFSTTVGPAQVSDAAFIRLIANTINWAQRD